MQPDFESVKQLYEEVVAANAERDKELLHGLEVERRHGELVVDWVNKLKPDASVTLQAAALFHDIDRIVNSGVGGGVKIDKMNGPKYSAYKQAHAKRSADFVYDYFINQGLPAAFAKRVAELILHHDDTREQLDKLSDPDLEALVAADSFGFFDSFIMNLYQKRGTLNVREKIGFMGGKMLPKYRQMLRRTKLESPEFEAMKNQVLDGIGT